MKRGAEADRRSAGSPERPASAGEILHQRTAADVPQIRAEKDRRRHQARGNQTEAPLIVQILGNPIGDEVAARIDRSRHEHQQPEAGMGERGAELTAQSAVGLRPRSCAGQVFMNAVQAAGPPSGQPPQHDPECAQRPDDEEGGPPAERRGDRADDKRRHESARRGAAGKNAVAQATIFGGSRLAVTRKAHGQLNASPRPRRTRVQAKARGRR